MFSFSPTSSFSMTCRIVCLLFFVRIMGPFTRTFVCAS